MQLSEKKNCPSHEGRAPRIFISYSSKDREAAETIHRKLASAGFDVWRDKRVKTDWSREIGYALAEADALCLLWTEHSAESKWVKHEWLTARALEKRILILRFPNSPDLPKPLGNLHRISFKKINKGCNELIERLKGETSFTEKYDYGVLPANSYIPFNPNPDFTGRHTDLLDLYLKMIGDLNKIGINQVGAVGMGGIGKTQLAVEFAHRFGYAFKGGIYWIQAADTGQWRSQFVSLARDRLGLKILNPDSPQKASKQYVFKLKKHFKKHPNTLVIIDNVTEPGLLNSEAFLFGETPLTLGCDVLFTTRRHFSLPGVESHPVDVLSRESALVLLTCGRKPETPEEQRHAKAICSAVGYLPLALVLAAGYLRKRRRCTFGKYRKKLRKNRLRTIDQSKMNPEQLATRHLAAIEATLKEQWVGLKERTSRHVFRLAGLFGEGEIIPKSRLGLLAGVAQCGDEELDDPLEESLILLRELNLVEELGPDGNAVRLHPLVRDFAAGLIPEKRRTAFKSKAAHNLKKAYDDFPRMESELINRGVNEIIGDLQVALDWWGKGDQGLRELRLLESALRLSANQLSKDPDQLLAQLLGRLMSKEGVGIRGRLEQATKEKRKPWLRILSRSLLPAGGPLLRTLEGHGGEVNAVALTPDGRVAVSASSDKTVKVWNVRSGQEIHSLEKDGGQVNAVAITDDGKMAVLASDDKTVKVRDLSSGEVLHTLKGHDGEVNAVAITADGKLAVSGSDDRTLRVWDPRSGGMLRTLEGHDGSITAVTIAPDGNKVVSGSDDMNLIAWDLESGTVSQTLKGHSSTIDIVVITPDGRTALSSSDDMTLKVWDLSSGEATQTLHSEGFRLIPVVVPDGRWAVTASYDRTFKVQDVQSGKVMRTLEGHGGLVNAVALTADGKMAVSASNDGTLKVWDLSSGEAPYSKEGHYDEVNDLAISPDGKMAVSASEDGSLKVWDLRAGGVTHVLEGHRFGVNAVAISFDGRTAVSASEDETVRVWDLGSGKQIHTFKKHRFWVTALAITADGRMAVSGSAYGYLRILDLRSGAKASRRLKGHRDYVNAVAISHDDKAAVSASDDGTLKVWDLRSGKAIRTLEGHSDGVNAVAITPDGKAAISASDDGTLKVWDLKSREETRTLQGHDGGVKAVTVTLNGKIAVSASGDKTVRIWSLKHGEELARFTGEYGMSACAVAPDGKTIVAGEAFGRVHFLRLEGVE